jgi:hypothetical protein
MRDIWKKHNILVSVSGFCVLFLLLIFFVIRPLESKIQSSFVEIQKKIIDDGLNVARIQKIPEMNRVETNFSENKDNLNVILSSGDEVDCIKRLEALANETGNKIDLKIDEAVPGSNVKAPVAKKDPEDIKSNLTYSKFISLQINLEGDYEQMINFVKKIENMGYYINILSLESVKFSPQQFDENGNPFIVNNRAVARGKQAKVSDAIKTKLGAVVYLKD